MQFNDYVTTYQLLGRNRPGVKQLGLEEFHRSMIEEMGTASLSRQTARNQLAGEHAWYQERCPYYNVWPAILPALLKLDLAKVPATALRLPCQTLVLRLPVDSRVSPFDAPPWGSFWLQSVFVSALQTYDKHTKTLLPSGAHLVVYPSCGEYTVQGRYVPEARIAMGSQTFPVVDRTVGDLLAEVTALQHNEDGLHLPNEVFDAAFRLLAACCLLGDDPALISPDVLSKDKHRFDPYHPDQALIERAKRKGKVGWNVGEALERTGESSPHFRMPHLALYHTGPGGSIPRIQLRTGREGGPIVVHRDRLREVPTGYQYDSREETQGEPVKCDP